jgi:hypothetical protein
MVCWLQEGEHRALDPFDTKAFEYEITEGQRKGDVPPPEGDGWVELDWRRNDFTDEALWRRPRIKPSKEGV